MRVTLQLSNGTLLEHEAVMVVVRVDDSPTIYADTCELILMDRVQTEDGGIGKPRSSGGPVNDQGIPI